MEMTRSSMQKITASTLLLLALFLFSTPRATATLVERKQSERGVVTLEDGTEIQWQEFPGVGALQALRYTFTPTHIVINCPSEHKDFMVFVGPSMPDIRAAYERKDKAWCGWDHFTGNTPYKCITPIPPGIDTFVSVAKPKSSSLSWSSKSHNNTQGSSKLCTMERIEEFSMHRLLAAVLGTFMFVAAPSLSESTPFRLTGGALGFTAASFLVVLFLLYRSMPQKKTLAVTTALFGSSMMALTRYVFGTWLPSAHQLLANPVVVAYLVLSALTGLAVTYYFNDETNAKLNTILKVALQLLGLTVVAFSSTIPEGTIALLSAVVGSKLAQAIREKHEGMRGGARTVAREAYNTFTTTLGHPVEQQPAVTVGRLPATPPHHVQAAQIPTWLAEAPAAATPQQQARLVVTQAAPAVSPLIERGMVLNEETGRTIKIGKDTYNKLIEDGYVVDKAAGTITPPPGGSSSSKKSSGRRKSSAGRS